LYQDCEVRGAVAQAEHDIIQMVERCDDCQAGTRPAAGQPGTLAEQLHAVHLLLGLPLDLRHGSQREEAWQACLDHARGSPALARLRQRQQPKQPKRPREKKTKDVTVTLE